MKGIRAVTGRALVLTIAFFIIHNSHAQSGYTVTDRGPDWKVLQKTTVEHGTNHVHRYVELATGLNYTNAAGQLVEAREEITILPTGGAVANQGRHQVYFPADIYNGVLEVVTPDGRHLRSRPLGVSYDDGSNTVFIATLKHAIGYLTSSNTVTYRDAFDGFKGDLVCQYRRGGFECDLVFRQQPPAPGDYGLDASFSTLQMVTEFFNTADPEQIPAGGDDWFGLQDTTLKFGSLTMTHGKAFAFSSTNAAPQVRTQTPVYKSWLHTQGRTFLIEQVPLLNIAEDLDALPLTARLTPQMPDARPKTLMASLRRQYPASHAIVSDTNQILLAAADFTHEPGVVLDYNEITTDQTDFTFAAGQTYYINGSVYLDGTTTFQGGAVIKINAASLEFPDDATIICDSVPERPTIFTSFNDDSVGETISGSSGSPAVSDVNLVLDIFVPSLVLSNLDFYYGGNCIQMDQGNLTLWNCRFKPVDLAVTAYDNYDYTGYHGGSVTLHNVLIQEIWDDTPVSAPNGLIAENVTLNGYVAINGGVSVNNYFITNCLIVVEASQSGGVPFVPGSGEYVSVDGGTFQPASNPVFTACGQDYYYLATNSLYRNAGVTSISPDLLAELQAMTTYAPQDGGSPDTNAPDLGYHYPLNEDSNHDGIPDWWIWHWFGSYAYNGTNVDSTGTQTLLYDYQNNLDPNIIQYSIEVTNNYVTNSTANLHLDVTAGVPAYYAVLVDDTNYLAATSWTAYTADDITASLGSLQGWHELWVGLKGCATNATVTWQWKRLKLDTASPQLVITTPTNSLVDVPMIQIAGFCPEPLDKISYDLTNALGLLTNLDAGVTSQYYSTNTWELTTNYIEALDIPLTNGLNTVIFHLTDLAGNVTTTNFSFTLDYSGKTNPPVVSITWPQDGMTLCGTNFTLRGQVNDPTVTVTASITDTNGNTNVLTGVVERNGRFWLEYLPLNAGTNALSITISDAVGNTTVTNLGLVQSGQTLTMNPVANNMDLWQPTLNLSGTVSDPGVAIDINGVTATNNGDGTWTATGVPTTPGGVADFVINAVPLVGAHFSFGQNINKEPRLFMIFYMEGDGGSTHADFTPYGYKWTFDWTLNNGTLWLDGWGGGASSYCKISDANVDGAGGYIDGWDAAVATNPASVWPNVPDGTRYRTYFDETFAFGYSYPGQTNYTSDVWSPVLVEESCNVKLPVSATQGWPYPWRGSTFPEAPQNKGNYFRVAQALMTLKTGGKAVSAQKSLFCLTGSAGAMKDKYAYPGKGAANQITWASSYHPETTEIAMKDVIVDGQPLGNDGKLWRAYADGDTRDVTPRVKKIDFYTFDVQLQQKYIPTIRANSTQLDPDIVVKGAKYCVGQSVDFDVVGLPDEAVISPIKWSFGGYFVNDHTNAGVNSSENYFMNSGKLTNSSQNNWWVGWTGGGDFKTYTAQTTEGLTFANGQNVTLSIKGKLNVWRPDVLWSCHKVSSVAVDNSYDGSGAAYLHFGTTTEYSGGVEFNKQVFNLFGFSGTFSPIQLIDESLLVCGTNGNSLHLAGVGRDDPDLVTLPSDSSRYQDSPAIKLEDDNYHVAMQHANFRAFLMFTPSGGISVPLKLAEWNWFGSADKVGGVWSKSSGDGAVTATDTSTTEFPAWTNLVHGQAPMSGFTSYTNSNCN